MSIDYKKAFAGQLKERFAPALRSVGFKGSGVHFRRLEGDVINAIWIQGSRDGTKCSVNLGLHLAFIPISWRDELPDVGKIKEVDCEFRDRATPQGLGDYWWEYGSFLTFPSKAIEHLLETYFECGESKFRAYSTVDAVANMFSPEQLLAATYVNGFGGMTVPRAALAMARIRIHLGQPKVAAEYARVGLARLGNGLGLKSILETIAGEP